MKHNTIVLIALLLGLILFGCKKQEQETLSPKIKNDKVEATATTATFTWTVDWPGKLISVVEVSENEDMSDSQIYGSETETENHNFTVTVTDLEDGTKYFFRYLVWNKFYVDNKFKMEVDSFTTRAITKPTVTTSTISDITCFSATCGGEVTDDGELAVTERGVYYGTSPAPSTTGTKMVATTAGEGSFSIQLVDLENSTRYYVQAYAINSLGCSYGDEVSFETNAIPTYRINVSASPADDGSVTGGGTYEQGQSCTVKALPVTGCYFTGWTEDGSLVSSNASYTFMVTSSRTLKANFAGQPQVPTGAIANPFTVDDNGKQVYFSIGNLQYRASTNIWRFASNQWDFVGGIDSDGVFYGNVSGSSNSDVSSTYNGWIDLFSWGTSGYDHGAVCYQPWSTTFGGSNYYAYGNPTNNLYDQTGKADWGYNKISNGGNQANIGWRTLTKDEWEYVIRTRKTESGIRFAYANVNNVNGVILLPDSWNKNYYSLNNTNYSSEFTSNTITATQWSTLEQHGAVFLPADGWRDCDYQVKARGVGKIGNYWSSSFNNDDYAWTMDYWGGCCLCI